jgi:sulfane dehydrogenase subunit SoxC
VAVRDGMNGGGVSGMWDPATNFPEGASASPEVTMDELQLAQRNHGMHLEGLRYDVTPVGIHYLLIHFDIPEVNDATWTLSVGGLVREPLELSMADLRTRPSVTVPVTMECAGNGRARLSPRPISQPWLTEAIGTAEWTGTPLRPLLEETGVRDEAVELVFAGADRGVQSEVEQDYERSLSIADAMREEVILAYGMNGESLPPQHGFPLRLLVPGWYGMASVKWLTRVTAVDEPFEGFQQLAYRFRQRPGDEGSSVTRMSPRSLMIPPGIPDFMTRRRLVDAGDHVLRGRAWSGWGPVERVDVSTDGGATWADAELGEPRSPYAWTPWKFGWDASTPGSFELCPRATDAVGNIQPLEQPWNLHGFANNMVQRVPVEVRTAAG